jgi:hypothetical protein
MLKRFILNATAAQSPVKSSGVAETSVAFSDCSPTNAESKSRLNVCPGG